MKMSFTTLTSFPSDISKILCRMETSKVSGIEINNQSMIATINKYVQSQSEHYYDSAMSIKGAEFSFTFITLGFVTELGAQLANR